ncbi:MAG: four helix bundle protein [Rubripirellula sp.]
MRDFKDLKVWEKSHAFVLNVYNATRQFPSDERFGLTSQIRRSSASVPTNLAEGCGRRTDKDLAHFCDIAMGSASESEYQLILARDLDYIDPEKHRNLEEQLLEVKRMLNSFTAAVRCRIAD